METVSILPEAADLINVGTTNYLEADLMNVLNLNARGYGEEIIVGYPLVIWALLVVLFITSKYFDVKREEQSQALCVQCILALVVVSNVRQQGIYSVSKGRDGEEKLESVSVPPDDCEIFFIEDSFDNVEKNIFQGCLMQMDAQVSIGNCVLL